MCSLYVSRHGNLLYQVNPVSSRKQVVGLHLSKTVRRHAPWYEPTADDVRIRWKP